MVAVMRLFGFLSFFSEACGCWPQSSQNASPVRPKTTCHAVGATLTCCSVGSNWKKLRFVNLQTKWKLRASEGSLFTYSTIVVDHVRYLKQHIMDLRVHITPCSWNSILSYSTVVESWYFSGYNPCTLVLFSYRWRFDRCTAFASCAARSIPPDLLKGRTTCCP